MVVGDYLATLKHHSIEKYSFQSNDVDSNDLHQFALKTTILYCYSPLHLHYFENRYKACILGIEPFQNNNQRKLDNRMTFDLNYLKKREEGKNKTNFQENQSFKDVIDIEDIRLR